MNKNRKNLIYIALFAIISMFLAGKIDTSNPEYAKKDYTYYRQMAINYQLDSDKQDERKIELDGFITHKYVIADKQDVIAPFAFRIAGPWLVSVFFENVDFGFSILNFISLFFIPIVFYFFLLESGINSMVATFFAVIISFNRYFFQFPAWNNYHINDTFSFLLILIALLLIIKKDYLPLLILMPVAVFFKEYILLLIPLLYIYLIRNKEVQKSYLIISVASFTSIAIFILLRQTIPASGGETLVEQIRTTVLAQLLEPLALPKRLLIAFTPFGFIPFVFYKRTFKFIKLYPEYIAFFIACLGISFIGVDGERLIVTALPLYLLYIAWLVSDLFTIFKKKSNKRNWLFQILIISMLASIYHLWGIAKLPSRNISIIYTIAILCLMAILFIYISKLKNTRK